MQEHQKRVVAEKQELDERLLKLVKFLFTPVFDQLDEAEQERLQRQAKIMADYQIVLDERIAACKE